MNRRTLLATGLALLATPKSALAARDRTIPYTPRDTFPYYDPITELRAEHVDDRIWPAVKRINNSGWVWTAESCQGHSRGWSDKPMLRLVCRSENAGKMLDELLASAKVGQPDRVPLVVPDALEMRRHVASPRGWFELRVFVKRGGIAFFDRFAARL